MYNYLIRRSRVSDKSARVVVRAEGVDCEFVVEIPVSPTWDTLKIWDEIHNEIERRLDGSQQD